MNSVNRVWSILCWNVRGLNSAEKWPLILSKIDESLASIICFQETKRGEIDLTFLKKFVPRRFDQFAYVPSDGASGGLLVTWASNSFVGRVMQQESFGIIIQFTSRVSSEQFNLVNVYGPCEGIERENFIAWLFSLDISDEDHWLLMGDFNFYRYTDSRSRPGANLDDIETFNEVISHLGLIELPLKGRAYTWSNMQSDPLLVQLDWFFTSNQWTLTYPNTLVTSLARPTSDHVPCVISIGSSIPKAKVFRFENYWIKMPGFLDVVQNIWAIHCHGDTAKCISSKLKLLRKGLKNWSTSISVVNKLVENCNATILKLDEIEEDRVLHITEWNFRNIVKSKLCSLLSIKHEFWKKRCTARWAKLNSENTSYFHTMATIRYRQNSIASLTRNDGSVTFDHHEKAGLLRQAFKSTLGTSVPIDPTFDFYAHTSVVSDLEELSIPFSVEEIDAAVADLPTDKAPGPDGFNGLFLKVCWPIIKYDFYRLCDEFWRGTVNLQSINDAFITLIPKVNSPRSPNDFC